MDWVWNEWLAMPNYDSDQEEDLNDSLLRISIVLGIVGNLPQEIDWKIYWEMQLNII